MATFWAVSAPLFSHTDWGGFSRTVQELRRRGHDTLWVSESQVASALSKMDIPFAPIPKTGWLWPPPPIPDITQMKPQEAVMLRYERALNTWLTVDLVAQGIESILELAQQRGKPTAILSDPFLTAAAIAAEVLDVPLIVCGWTATHALDDDGLFPVQRMLGSSSRERIQALLDRFEVKGVNISDGATPFMQSPLLHISYFCSTWHQEDESNFNLLPQNCFVGGLPETPTDPPPTWLTSIPEDALLGVVTLGTTFAGELGFFSWAAQAMARAGLIPVVAIGWHAYTPDEKQRLKDALPPSTRLLNWIDFAHVLPRTRLIAHHGGMGTTHWAVRYGIPQIIVPHAADQRGQARRAAQAKVGLHLTAHDVRQGALFTGVKALARDENVLANARTLADEMHALGGVPAAADRILSLLNV